MIRIAFYKYHRTGLAGLFDQLIRTVTKGPYSHCELIFPDDMAYSASIQDGGCRFKAIVFDPARWDIIELPWLSHISHNMIEDFCLKERGSKYDYPGAFRFLLPGIPESKERWFCSEIVCAALQTIDMLGGIKAWQVHPSKLYELLKGNS